MYFMGGYKMKFKVKSFANGVLSSEWEVEAENREEALEQIINEISDFEIVVDEV